MRKIIFGLFLKIYHFLLKVLHVSEIEQKLKEKDHQILELQMSFVKVCYKEFYEEANYILKNGLIAYPYELINGCGDIESGYDYKKKLPYVIHKGKRLYFPSKMNENVCKLMYKKYIENECLLGGKFRKKQPHQYLTDTFNIEAGDVLVDVGCAEALLTLDSIDKVSRAYLVESDLEWMPALYATFENYMDKIEVINKYVADKDTESTITLQSILKKENDKQMFIKMDIEGAEVSALEGSREFLTSCNKIKLACCTYHRQDDAEVILSIYEKMGFKYEFSDGYMLFMHDKDIKAPYFRHGVLRGWK